MGIKKKPEGSGFYLKKIDIAPSGFSSFT
jgi:hypothetical protein